MTLQTANLLAVSLREAVGAAVGVWRAAVGVSLKGGEGRAVNRASLSDTVTRHRWRTIVQKVTFQQAADTSEKQRVRGEDGNAHVDG